MKMLELPAVQYSRSWLPYTSLRMHAFYSRQQGAYISTLSEVRTRTKRPRLNSNPIGAEALESGYKMERCCGWIP